MATTRKPGTLLTFLECTHSPCTHSSMTYKQTSLCENWKTCPIRLKTVKKLERQKVEEQRQQKAQKSQKV